MLHLLNQNGEENYVATSQWDKWLIGLSSLYLFMWFGSLFQGTFENDHGVFFNHIGTITLAYLTITVASFLSKSFSYYHRLFSVTSFSVLAFLISFATFGMFISMVVAIVVAILAGSRNLNTNVVTGTMVGYWIVLLFRSSLEYDLFGAFGKGFWAVVAEIWTIFWNVTSFEVFDEGLGFLGAIVVVGIGLLFAHLFGKKEKTSTESKQMKENNEKVFHELVEQKVQDRIGQKTAKGEVKAETTETKEEKVEEEPKKIKTRKEYKEQPDKPSKQFFDVKVPLTSKRMNNFVEKILRHISK